jgi:uncharacterized RDD family membrane protein YckC
MKEGVSTQQSIFAGLFKRGFAVMIDLFLMLIVFLALNLPFSASASWNYSSSPSVGFAADVIYKYPLNSVLFLLALIIYFTFFEYLWGATIGKMIFRIKVVDEKKEKISLRAAFLKNVCIPIDIFFGCISLLFSSQNQTLGDRIAKTFVINKKLAHLPVVDAPISRARRVCASILTMIAIIFVGAMVWTVPKIWNFNEISRADIERIQKVSGSDMRGLYDSFASEFTESISFETFEESFSSPEFLDLLMNLHADNIIFYEWQFDTSQAMITGNHNNVRVRISYIKNDAGEWKLLGVLLKSGMEM